MAKVDLLYYSHALKRRGLFENVEMTMEVQVIAAPAKYRAVNSKWPEGTRDGRDLKPTPQESVTAARRLYRYIMKRPFTGAP